MWIREILLAIAGLSAGVAVAGGLFSFIVELGVIADFADRTHTGDKVCFYEDCAALGGILGNLVTVFHTGHPGRTSGTGGVRDLYGDLRGMLGHGAGGDPECISSVHAPGADHPVSVFIYRLPGCGQRAGGMSVLFQRMVEHLIQSEV